MEFSDFEREILDRGAQDMKMNPGSSVAGLSQIFELFMYRKIKNASDGARKIYWITVNPKPTISLTEFRKIVEDRFVKRTFMEGAIYCYEQRSTEPDIFHGMHLHLMVDKRMSPKQMFDRVFNTFKDIVGNKRHVDIREYPYSYREQKLDYLQGKKWDSDKDASVEVTRMWRFRNGLDDYAKA